MAGNEELLAGILAKVPQPVWVVDHPGRIVFANAAALATLGYDDAEQVLGRSAHETIHYKRPDGSPYPLSECPMLRVRDTGETLHSEDEWFVRRDGTMFPIAWWSAPIRMDGGHGAVLAFADITERRRARAAAREQEAAQLRASESRAALRRVLEHERSVRQAVARDLHDGAQQRLVTLLIALQLARESVEMSNPAAAHLDHAFEQAQRAIDELRALAADVYPAVLADRGLAPALVQLGASAGVDVVVSDHRGARQDEAAEAFAYFLVSDAVADVARHAGTNRVDVTIEAGRDGMTLVIAGDGDRGPNITALLPAERARRPARA